MNLRESQSGVLANELPTVPQTKYFFVQEA